MDNRRLLFAALLSLGVLILWQTLFPPPPPVDQESLPPAVEQIDEAEGVDGAAVPPAAPPSGETTSPAEPVEEVTQTLVADPTAAAAEEEVVVETEQFSVRFTNRGGQIRSFRLKQKLDRDREPLELVRQRAPDDPLPLAFVDSTASPLPLNDALFVVERERRADGESVLFTYAGPEGQATKRFVFDDGPTFEMEIAVAGVAGDWGLLLGPGVRNPQIDVLESRTFHRSLSYLVAEDLEELKPDKIEAAEIREVSRVRWLGLEDTYFLTALMPTTPLQRIVAEPVRYPGEDGGFLRADELGEAEEDLPRGLMGVVVPAAGRLEASAYWGPKEYETLHALPYGLEKTIRWGMFGLLSRPLLFGLTWTYDNVVGNWGWAIVLMTILIKLVLFPLTHKSYVSMQKLQKLNPRMEAIRQKYRPKLKDKQGRPNLEMQRKMNEEMQALFKEEGVNPAGGCLPILLQIPVFLAFFNLLRSAVELWNAPWMFWIKDLSVPDPYYVIPLVMGATQVLQQRLTPPPPNPSQQIVMKMMPVVFTIFSLGFPAGLVLYWLTNNVLTIVQQGGYNRLKKAGFFGGEQPSDATGGQPGKGRRSKKGK